MWYNGFLSSPAYENRFVFLNDYTESTLHYWRCPNCGQVHFGETPPDMCAFCNDFTTWQLLLDDETPTNTEQPYSKTE